MEDLNGFVAFCRERFEYEGEEVLIEKILVLRNRKLTVLISSEEERAETPRLF